MVGVGQRPFLAEHPAGHELRPVPTSLRGDPFLGPRPQLRGFERLEHVHSVLHELDGQRVERVRHDVLAKPLREVGAGVLQRALPFRTLVVAPQPGPQVRVDKQLLARTLDADGLDPLVAPKLRIGVVVRGVAPGERPTQELRVEAVQERDGREQLPDRVGHPPHDPPVDVRILLLLGGDLARVGVLTLDPVRVHRQIERVEAPPIGRGTNPCELHRRLTLFAGVEDLRPHVRVKDLLLDLRQVHVRLALVDPRMTCSAR